MPSILLVKEGLSSIVQIKGDLIQASGMLCDYGTSHWGSPPRQHGHVMWTPALILQLLSLNVPDYSLKLHSQIASQCGDFRLYCWWLQQNKCIPFLKFNPHIVKKNAFFVLRRRNSNSTVYSTSITGVPMRSRAFYNGLGIQW